MEEKMEVRRRMKQLRQQLTQGEREAVGAAVGEQLFSMREFTECQIFFTYLSYGQEIPTHVLTKEAILRGKLVAAPKVTGEGGLTFYQIHAPSDCVPGAFGILEPEGGRELTPDMGRSLLLLPGLAFTKAGGRLGYGGGYYDRYLAAHPQAFLAAPAYPFSVVGSLPEEAHDIRADALVLPGEVFYVQTRECACSRNDKMKQYD